MLGSTAGIPLEEEVNRDALTDNSTVYTVSMDHLGQAGKRCVHDDCSPLHEQNVQSGSISMSRTTNSDFEASVGFLCQQLARGFSCAGHKGPEHSESHGWKVTVGEECPCLSIPIPTGETRRTELLPATQSKNSSLERFTGLRTPEKANLRSRLHSPVLPLNSEP